MNCRTPSGTEFDTFSTEEILAPQLNHKFYVELRFRLNNGESLFFVVDENVIVVRADDKGNQIVTPHSLKELILYIYHYFKLAGHPGGPKVFNII